MKAVKESVIALAFLQVFTSFPAEARSQHHGWRGDIHSFDRYDAVRWRSGAWRHGHHDGRMGWWWVVGGIWYFHQRPIYPYPNPYRPPVVFVEPNAPVAAAVPAAPAPQVWYYCDAAAAYYPYVPSCPTGWKTVPAVPPGASQ